MLRSSLFWRAKARGRGRRCHPTTHGSLAIAGCWRIPFSSRVRAGCFAAGRGLASQHGCRRSVGASHGARGSREPGVAPAAARHPLPTPATTARRSRCPPRRPRLPQGPGPAPWLLRAAPCPAPFASAFATLQEPAPAPGTSGRAGGRRRDGAEGDRDVGAEPRAGPHLQRELTERLTSKQGKKRQAENAHETRPGRCPRKSPAPRGRAPPPPAPPRSPALPGAAAPSGSPPRAGGSRGTKQSESKKPTPLPG